MKRRSIGIMFGILILALVLGGCRNETQNQIRRSIQDFTADKMYITVYSLTGDTVFEGVVDGKVTRSSDQLSNGNGLAPGGYIYWFDERGRYHQTDLPYMVTTYDRSANAESRTQ